MEDTNESEKVQKPDHVHPSGDTSVCEAALYITFLKRITNLKFF